MSLNQFFSKCRKSDYICSHFTRDLWLALTGEDISSKLQGLFDSKDLQPNIHNFRSFKRLCVPEDPCLVLMLQLGRDPHIGVHVKGRLFHLGPRVPEFMPLELGTRGFTTVRYYK